MRHPRATRPAGIGIAFWFLALAAPAVAAPAYDPEEAAVAAWANTARQDVAAFCAACRRLDPGIDCEEWGTATNLPPLHYEPRAAESARFHSEHMADAPCFQHESCCELERKPDGSVGCKAAPCSSCNLPTSCPGTDTFARYSMLGYGAIAGENIAAGSPTSLDATCGWMDSPGHRTNLLDRDFDEHGVGLHRDGSRCLPYLWTHAFGANRVTPAPGLVTAAGAMPGNPGAPLVAGRGDQTLLAHVAADQNVVLVRAVIDGNCVSLTRTLGDAKRGLWTAGHDLGAGCHELWFVATTEDGTRGTFPPTGAMGFGDDMSCPESTTRTPAACEGEDACDDEGATRPCWPGEPDDLGVGACRPGTQACEGNAWSACAGAVLPEAETCNGLDDDCDGETDERPNDVGASCDSGWAGPCASGRTACAGGRLVCVRDLEPATEACNNVDDDCDGTVDDGFGEQFCGTGACQRRASTCSLGELVTCVPGVSTSDTETCGNGLDDDCDGTADEGCPCSGTTRACWTGPASWLNKGRCASGTQACVEGTWGECIGARLPVDETCNGLDDDCDGAVDEELGRDACGSGACRVSTGRCVSGTPRACSPLDPLDETCDGTDDDCDGEIDEGCACPPGLTQTCFDGDWNLVGIGACVAGTNRCKADGTGFSACEGQVGPATERCANGIDEDCDGAVDEADCVGGVDAGDGEPPPPEGCGCGGGGAWIVAWVGLLARRRTRTPF